jgi:signal transduction histidine kinase
MAAGVAHEINNPLSGIMIYAELIKKNLMRLESENRQNIEDIQE